MDQSGVKMFVLVDLHAYWSGPIRSKHFPLRSKKYFIDLIVHEEGFQNDYRSTFISFKAKVVLLVLLVFMQGPFRLTKGVVLLCLFSSNE